MVVIILISIFSIIHIHHHATTPASPAPATTAAQPLPSSFVLPGNPHSSQTATAAAKSAAASDPQGVQLQQGLMRCCLLLPLILIILIILDLSSSSSLTCI